MKVSPMAWPRPSPPLSFPSIDHLYLYSIIATACVSTQFSHPSAFAHSLLSRILPYRCCRLRVNLPSPSIYLYLVFPFSPSPQFLILHAISTSHKARALPCISIMLLYVQLFSLTAPVPPYYYPLLLPNENSLLPSQTAILLLTL